MLCYRGQNFGANANPSYAAGQLKGHPGIDVSCGWGSPITAHFDAYIYKVFIPERPANDGYTAVFMIVDDGIELFEWIVGHCKPTVKKGQYVKKGDVIGTEANHGLVYSGNILITLAMQRAGDQRGHHRHYQKRPLMKVRKRTGLALTAEGGSLYRDQEGYYYQYADPNNGFSGCTSPVAPVFQRNLWFGSSGYDVLCVQRLMQKESLFTVEPTAFFGPITGAAVTQFQKRYNISPTLGYVGPITRAKLLTYTRLPDLSSV
jgi:hypothetical protein